MSSPIEPQLFRTSVKKRNKNQIVAAETCACEVKSRAATNRLRHRPIFFLEVLFVCECDDESCGNVIPLSCAEYYQTHLKECQFVVLPGHEDSTREEVKERFTNYMVVDSAGSSGLPGFEPKLVLG
jgi:hypothetical protein